MSSIQTRFLPFGEWSPDSVEFEAIEMEIASNFTPSYGAFRPIEKLKTISDQTDSEAANGGIAHIVSEEEPPVRMQPEAEGSDLSGKWWDQEYETATVDNDYHADHLNQFGPVDGTFIRSDGDNGGILSYTLTPPVVDPAPVVTGDLVFKFRIRLKSRTISRINYAIDYELWETNGPTQISTTQTFTGVTDEWQEVSWEVPNAVFGALTGNYDALEIKFLNWTYTPVPTDPPPWESDKDEDTGDYKGYDSAGDVHTEDLYVHIHGPRIGETLIESYIQSSDIPPGESDLAGFRWNTMPPPLDPTPGADWFEFRVDAAAQELNTELTVKFLQPVAVGQPADDDEVLFFYGDLEYRTMYEQVISDLALYDAAPPTVYTSLDLTVQVPEFLERYNFDSPFYLALTTSYAGGGAGKKVYATATRNYQTNSSFVSGTYDDVNNTVGGKDGTGTDDATKCVYTGGKNGERSIYLDLGPRSKPTSKDGHEIWVRARWSGTQGAATCRAGLYQTIGADPTLVKNDTFSPTTSFAWHKVGLANVPTALDFNDVGVRVWVNSPDQTLEVSEVYYKYPGDSGHARIYDVYAEQFGADYPMISWAGLDAINPKKTNARDRTELYVGNLSHLYQVKDDAWVNVDRAAVGPDGEGPEYSDLVSLNVAPKIWDFCTFGDKVIATNFTDEIQVKDVTDQKFLPLFGTAGSPGSTPYAPRARFCAVVGSQLVLADINSDNYGTQGTQLNYNGSGKPFHIWCSAPMEPDYFDVANLAKQSALFSLVGQPGAITGLVGGEWGTVFKRNSIWRLQYVGLPQIMQLDQIAIGQGCSHPQSIVQVGQDIFFWGNGGIFAVSQGSQLIRLSGQKIEKAIFDTLYEEIALAQDFGVDSIENEARVYGAYDAYSGVVWWLYRGKEDEENKLNRFLCYSTQEDRFTHGLIEDMDLSLILGRANITTSDNFLNRGFIGFSYQNTKSQYQRLSDTTETYAGLLRTKIISSATWGFRIGQEVEIQSIRPIYKADPDDYRPYWRIVVEASQDPTMQRDRVERTVSSINEDRDGWIPVGTPVSGEFWRFTVNTPEFSNSQLKEILGLQIKLTPRGDY